jgi:iron-sulfur cluster assembly accessory protein
MNVTQKAQARINQTLTDSEALRVSVNGGGCSGFIVSFSKEAESKSSDIWASHNVLTDSTSAAYLTAAILDFSDDAFAPTFKVEVPNTNSCGCGISFQFEEAKC